MIDAHHVRLHIAQILPSIGVVPSSSLWSQASGVSVKISTNKIHDNPNMKYNPQKEIMKNCTKEIFYTYC